MLNGLLVVGALIVLLAQHNNPTNWDLALIYFSTALPFFVSGAIVSLAIGETITHVHRVYFFDLMGAAAGCLLLYPLLNGFGGVSAVLGAAITFAVAAAIWHSVSGSVRGRVGSVALALALVAFLILNQRYHVIDIRHAKDVYKRQESARSRLSLTWPSARQPVRFPVCRHRKRLAIATCLRSARSLTRRW